MNRRDFLQIGGLAGLGALGAAACAQSMATAGIVPDDSARRGGEQPSTAPFPLASVGLQLYTVRTLLARDLDAGLASVAGAGYRLVETAGLYERTPAAFRALLDRHGLRTPAGHYSLEQLESKQPGLAAAGTLGQRYVLLAWLHPALRASPSDYDALADRLNRIGERCRAQGLRFAFHNHAEELETFETPTTMLERLVARTDPALVSFELDAYWAYKAGTDPVRLLRDHPGRFVLSHIKDGGPPPARTMTDVGAGVIDYAAFFAAAPKAGMTLAFVEHDNPTDPLASIRASRVAIARLLPAP